MIVITTPTGAIGRQVLAALVDGPEPVRVVTRDPQRLPEALRARVEVIAGSHGERDIMMRALDGADSLFWLVPGDPRAESAHAAYVDFARPGIEAMRACGVRRVVGVSALGRGWRGEAGHVTATLEMDDGIAATGAGYRALACSSLMENLLRQADGIAARGAFVWPSPADLAQPAVATRDVAATAAALLHDPGWSGVDSIPMMGPEDISFREMASVMTDVLGQEVRFEEISMEAMRAMTLARGASEGMAQAMVDMLTAKNDGLDHLVDRPSPNPAPTGFRAWCADVLAPAIAARRTVPA